MDREPLAIQFVLQYSINVEADIINRYRKPQPPGIGRVDALKYASAQLMLFDLARFGRNYHDPDIILDENNTAIKLRAAVHDAYRDNWSSMKRLLQEEGITIQENLTATWPQVATAPNPAENSIEQQRRAEALLNLGASL